MSEFTQQTFLGASIRSFTGSIGWSNNPSTVTVGLVVDPANGDKFITPPVGMPVLFNYSGWQFAGIVQVWHQEYDTKGNPVFEVIIEDPRQVLSGVQLVLSGYNGGALGVPNLLNIFGYLEDPSVFGFGGAQVNDAGIPWQNVVKGIQDLTSGTNPTYGGYIALAGYQYKVDLSALPQLPSYYRVPSNTISLMDFIHFVCESANCDYFFNMSFVGFTNVITLGIINRNNPPVFGAIDNFIAQNNGATAKSAGFEFRNEVTSKFLVGGPVSQMYFQTPNASGDISYPEQNEIWPFWGKDYDQSAIMGSGYGIHHSFNIPTRHANVFNLGDYYPTDVQELMAAAVNYTAWIGFLHFYNRNKWTNDAYDLYQDVLKYLGGQATNPQLSESSIFNAVNKVLSGSVGRGPYYEMPYQTGSGNNNVLINITDSNDNVITYLTRKKYKNPHFQKINKLMPSEGGENPSFAVGYLGAEFTSWVAGLTAKETTALNAVKFGPFENTNISSLSQVTLPGVPETGPADANNLHQLVSNYARTYLGQQFMVNIPFVSAVTQSETDALNPTNVVLSRQPVSSAYIDENDWDDAIANNYLPGDIDRIVDDQYKIVAYARYNDITNLDFTSIDESSIILSDNGQSAFLLCQVEPQVVFQDFPNLYSPRVVFKLPGPVFNLASAYNKVYSGLMMQFMLGEYMRTYWGQQYNNRPSPFDWATKFPKLSAIQNNIQNIQSAVTTLPSSPGSTAISYYTIGMYKMPDLIAVPLQSNIQQYGPWYATGAQGMLAFEENLNFVPWNFGDYDTMDQAGNAAVQSAICQYMQHEGGTVKVPGIPALSLGAALIDSGPYITDMQVSIASDGVTTTYNMGTWTPHPYKMRKEYSDYVTRINKQLQEARHLLRVQSRDNSKNTNLVADRAFRTAEAILHKTIHSPMLTIGGSINQTDDNVFQPTVVLDTHYGFAASINPDLYESTFGGTLDTLFVPFSTNQFQDASGFPSGIPHFQLSAVTGSGNPTVDDLNPFTLDYDASGNVLSDVYYGATIRGTGIPDTLVFDSANDDELETDNIRSIAFRSPMVIAGWGYDSFGNPMPSGDPNQDGTIPFASGYKVDMSSWKCGPVDLRWDDSRGVWAAGSTVNIKIVQIVNDGTNGSGGLFQRVYSVQEYKPAFTEQAGAQVSLSPIPSGQGIQFAGSFRSNIAVIGEYYLAYQIGTQYYIDNQSTFEDYSGA